MNIVKITSVDDWMIKAQKELKGFYPKKTIKISELTYPVKVQVDKDEGTFEIYVPKKEQPKKTNKKDKFSFYLTRFVYLIIVFALICILGFTIGGILL